MSRHSDFNKALWEWHPFPYTTWLTRKMQQLSTWYKLLTWLLSLGKLHLSPSVFCVPFSVTWTAHNSEMTVVWFSVFFCLFLQKDVSIYYMHSQCRRLRYWKACLNIHGGQCYGYNKLISQTKQFTKFAFIIQSLLQKACQRSVERAVCLYSTLSLCFSLEFPSVRVIFPYPKFYLQPLKVGRLRKWTVW